MKENCCEKCACKCKGAVTAHYGCDNPACECHTVKAEKQSGGWAQQCAEALDSLAPEKQNVAGLVKLIDFNEVCIKSLITTADNYKENKIAILERTLGAVKELLPLELNTAKREAYREAMECVPEAYKNEAFKSDKPLMCSAMKGHNACRNAMLAALETRLTPDG